MKLRYPDGRLIPQEGDTVYQIVRGPFGSPASIEGTVRKGKVVITTSASIFGALGPRRGKTYPLTSYWTVFGDPEIKRREQEREAKRRTEEAAWKASIEEYERRTRTSVEKAIRTEGHKPVNRRVKVGSIVIYHGGGQRERHRVGEIDAQGRIYTHLVGKVREGNRGWGNINYTIPPTGHNPLGSSLYESFHGNPPARLRRIRVNWPKKGERLIAIGRLSAVEYTPEWPSRKAGTRYSHELGDTGRRILKEKPILATRESGKGLFIIPDRAKSTRLTERGIVG